GRSTRRGDQYSTRIASGDAARQASVCGHHGFPPDAGAALSELTAYRSVPIRGVSPASRYSPRGRFESEAQLSKHPESAFGGIRTELSGSLDLPALSSIARLRAG